MSSTIDRCAPCDAIHNRNPPDIDMRISFEIVSKIVIGIEFEKEKKNYFVYILNIEAYLWFVCVYSRFASLMF